MQKGVEQPPVAKRLCTASLDVREIDMNTKQGSLVARLRLDPKKDSGFVPLPAPLLRKYIAYARTYIFPRLSNVLCLVFESFLLLFKMFIYLLVIWCKDDKTSSRNLAEVLLEVEGS
uniref:Putative ovule protein n=1 Tax=Solanum chacoense TaxID=4108 RepID=A0A0V0GPK9_SOLCH